MKSFSITIETNVLWLIGAFVLLIIVYRLINNRSGKRAKIIEAYTLPEKVGQRLQKRYPHLTDQDVTRALNALKQYFLLCLQDRTHLVAMPSRVVDEAWHEFILFTNKYHEFFRNALGYFIHHIPAEEMDSRAAMQGGLERTWRRSCLAKDIDPDCPIRLPQLFAVDEALGIRDGFFYTLVQDENGYYRPKLDARGVSGNTNQDSNSAAGGCRGCGCGG